MGNILLKIIQNMSLPLIVGPRTPSSPISLTISLWKSVHVKSTGIKGYCKGGHMLTAAMFLMAVSATVQDKRTGV